MNEPFREPREGEVFWLFRDKIHFHGKVEHPGDETIYVFWAWNPYKQRRHYKAVPQWALELDWEYMKKQPPKGVKRRRFVRDILL